MKTLTPSTWLVVLIFIFSNHAGKTKSQDALNSLKLEQEGTIWGRHTVTVTSDAFKVADQNTSIDYISHAPDWKLLIVNNRNRKFFEVEPAKFKGAPQGRMAFLMGDNILHRKFTKLGKEMIDGIETTKFTLHLSPALHLDSALQKKELRGYPNERTMDCYIENLYPLPAKSFPALSKLYGIDVEGLPIKLCWTKENGYPGVAVRTSRVQKVHTDRSEYSAPVNFKQSKTLTEACDEDGEPF